MRSFGESSPNLTRLENYEGVVAGEGIKKVVTNRLPEGVRGACVKCGGKKAIFISGKAKESKAAELETLSHERCHLAQNALYRLSSSKAEVDSAERKATAASYRELLPLPYIINSIFGRRMSFAEIALEAEVTEGFVAKAIAWYSVFSEFVEARAKSAKNDF